MNILFRDFIILAVTQNLYDTRIRSVIHDVAKLLNFKIKKIDKFE